MHPLPHTPSWRGAELVKHRDNFTFYLLCEKCTLDERPSRFIKGKFLISSERTLHKDYYHESSVDKISGRESQGA
jgi:hypothetical protein